jgi:ABC-type transport system substrate-binding protein
MSGRRDAKDLRGVSASSAVARRAISRRRFMILAGQTGAAAALAPLAAACTGNAGPSAGQSIGSVSGGGVTIAGKVPGPPPVSGGRYGGTLKAGYVGSIGPIDPAIAGGSSADDWEICNQLLWWGGLLAMDGQTGGPVPNIAESLKVSSDNTEITFAIRPGVKFHNGREVEAQDFKYSFERMIQLPLAWGSDYFKGVAGFKEFVDDKTKSIEGFEVKGSRTFIIHLATPDATFLSALAFPFAAPVPQEEVERLGDNFGKQPVGCGPFKLEKLDVVEQRAYLSRFDDYFWTGLPYVDEIQLRYQLNDALIFPQITSGELDYMADGDSALVKRQVAAHPELQKFVGDQIPVLGETWAEMYRTWPPLDDARVRQAMNWAVDRSIMQKLDLGIGWGYPFPEIGIPHLVPPYGLDLDKAKQLLADAGHPNGFETSMAIAGGASGGEGFPEFLVQQLQAVGIQLTLEQTPPGVLHANQDEASVPMAMSGTALLAPDAADIIYPYYTTGAVFNFDGYSDPHLDELAAEAKLEFDQEKRFAIYAEIEKIIMEDAKNLFLAADQFIPTYSPTIQNFHYRGETMAYYDRMWLAS